jgi:uncharacterized protein YjbI with pentapeptide repeats
MLTTKMIGNKIAEARKKMNVSQAQLAKRLFISSQAVGKWERGESMPDILTLNRLGEILGVDLNYFSDGVERTATETTVIEQPAGLSSRERKKQLSWNMSGGSWKDADFSGADLTGFTFKSSDVRDANFDLANLTDCNLSTLNLANASFNKSILVRTNFSKSGLLGTKFTGVDLTDVKLTLTDLKNTIFESCIFNGVDFNKSDMRGLILDGQIFNGVSFDNAALTNVSFRDATLNNVSFRSPYAVTNRYYRSIKTICFDGAKMDKLTYAVLKGLEVDLTKVAFIG